MPDFSLTPDQLDSLYQGGHISDAVYNSALAQNTSYMPDAQNNPQNYPTPQPQVPGSVPFQDMPDLNSGSAPFPYRPDYVPSPNDETYKDAALRAKQAMNPSLGLASDLPPQQPPTGSSLSTGSSLAPSALDAGYDQQINAVRDEAKAQGKQTNAQSDLMNKYNAEQQVAEQGRQASEMFRQGQAQIALDDLDKATTEASSLKVDPNHFWASASTGDKIIMGISLALGAVGAANDGQNRVVPIITAAIDRDIAAQKANIANAQQGVSQKASALSAMRSQFRDDRMAESAARVAAIERVKMQLAQKAMQFSDPEVKARAEKLAGALEVEKQKAKQKFIQDFATGVMGKLSPSDQLQRQKDGGRRSVSGLGMVDDERDAPAMRDAKANFDSIKKNILDQKKLADAYSGPVGAVQGFFSIDDSNKSKAMSVHLRQKINKLFGNGVMNDGDLAELLKMVPDDATSSTSINTANKLDTVLQIIKNEYRSLIDSRRLNDPSIDDPIMTKDKVRK